MASEVKRDKFTNKFEYFLTTISYAVGLGNVWRFPYLAYRNGGGSFLIPYFLSLLFLGISYFFFESSIGQFTQLGPIQIWRLSPIFRGIGFAMNMMCLYVGIYYNVIIAWSLYFIYASFTAIPDVPWSHCGNEWNTENCVEHGATPNISIANTTTYSPSQEFFYRNVLEMSAGIDHMDSIRPHLVLCLAIAWIFVGCGLSFGAKSMGKISYFTAILPYVVLTALLINGATLDGAIDGVLHYIEPDFSRLTSIDVWADAGTQIFFSLSICMGGVITLASYNPFHNNAIKDTLIVSVCNSFTSLYAGFAIFTVIGFMAKQIGKPVDEATDQGPGLTFVAYPAALSKLPQPWIWSVIFFVMLVVLGFGSQMTIVETLVVNLTEVFPGTLGHRKPLTLVVVCVALFLAGLPLCTQAGIYILHVMDTHAVGYSAFFIAFVEMIAIAWVYGLDRHMANLRRMFGFRVWPELYWKFMFKFGCPLIIVVILILVFINHSPLKYDDYIFPAYATGIGWAITMSSVLMIPAFALYEWSRVWRGKASYKDILKPDPITHSLMIGHGEIISRFPPPPPPPPYEEIEAEMGYDNPQFNHLQNNNTN